MSGIAVHTRLRVTRGDLSYDITAAGQDITVHASVRAMMALRRLIPATGGADAVGRFLAEAFRRTGQSVRWRVGPFKVTLLRTGGPTRLFRLLSTD